MNEDQFVNFFILLGVSLFLIGSFSSFAVDHYSDRLVAGEVLPLTACQPIDSVHLFSSTNDSVVCDRLTGAESLREASCATLDTKDRESCRKLQLMLDSQLDGCETGERTPADAMEMDALCEATGVKDLKFPVTSRS